MSTNFDEDAVYFPQVTKLREMLSETNGFQRQLGLIVGDPNSPTDAQERIFVPAIEPERLRAELPAAVIEIGTQLSLEIDAGGAQNVLGASGQLRLVLADKSRHPGDLRRATENFVAWCGAVITQLANVSAVDTNLAIVKITQELEPVISDTVESAAIGPWFLASYLVDWS